ncbi:hypothetical protein JNW88_00425 [Micromonospora sp. ATA32]|nr:hypothetical protein [Micromonospora sp. ATA32]
MTTAYPIVSYGRFTRRSLFGWHLEAGRYTDWRASEGRRVGFGHAAKYVQLRVGPRYVKAFRR